MLCLTDGSRFARTLTASVGSSVSPRALGDADRRLWERLHQTSPITIAEAPWREFWWRGVVVEHAPASQFDALAACAMSTFPLPGAVAAVAGNGPAFRGFHGRTWDAVAGNLHLAAAIPLRGCTAHSALLLALLPTLAVRDAIIEASGGRLRPGIKWVNDLYLGDGKVAGIVTRTGIIGNDADLLLAGIGVNVARAPQIATSPFVPGTAAAAGVDLRTLLEALLHAIERRTGEAGERGLSTMLEEYRSASTIIGREVRVYDDRVSESGPVAEWPPPVARGVVLGIGDDLSLVVDGARDPVSRGRLALEDDCRRFALAGR